MNYHLLSDDELHRVARDSTDPLTLELMRRMDTNGDERDAAVSEADRVGELESENDDLRDRIDRAIEALDDCDSKKAREALDD